MGNQLSNELANNDFNLSLDNALAIHLQSNHYPPVPVSMVPICIEAIGAYNDGDMQRLIKLPPNTSWRGLPSAPAIAIIESHHLDAWCDSDDDYYYDQDEV